MGRGATQRREAARQEMREDILQAAREMVAREGVANLSLRAVARTLGYSPAALYEYFPSKEAIAKELYFGGADGLAVRLNRAIEMLPPNTQPMEAKKALGRAYRTYALENEELFLLVFGSGQAFSTLSEQMEKNSDGFDALLETVRVGVESGDFAAMPVDVLAMTAWAAVHGFVMLELAGAFASDSSDCVETAPDHIAPDQLFELHMELIDTGMRRR